MFQRYAACLVFVPVLIAAWLVFQSKPVTGLPLDQVVLYQAEETPVATDAN